MTTWRVTGGAGWVGTNLLNHLVAAGRPVRALALPSEALALRARYGAAVDVVEGDVRDQAAVGEWAVGTHGATVVHLAGVIHPKTVADFQTINVDGTRNVLEAALAAGAGFGLLHLPNLSLMRATFVGGTAWAWLGQKHRALLPLAASHVVLGLAWLWLAPTWLLRSAEIGGRFLMPP